VACARVPGRTDRLHGDGARTPPSCCGLQHKRLVFRKEIRSMIKWRLASVLPLLLQCSGRPPALSPGAGRAQPSDSRDASSGTGASSSSLWNEWPGDIPELWIRVESVDGEPMFYFELCIPPPPGVIVDGGWQSARWIGHIAVQDVPGEGNTSYCWLDDNASGDFRNLASGWLYGTVPAHFQRKDACAPLRRGKKFAISVGGTGSGMVTFHIEDSGRAVVDEDRCEKARLARNL
jgi:hypothetical protein